ncbi:MAG: efflux transporter outer membrane subunit, partial [Gammaproteobacteria bacterium]|nr:efflux transporter outer membrane subunit [Gammaproteobacteria bacterium]
MGANSFESRRAKNARRRCAVVAVIALTTGCAPAPERDPRTTAAPSPTQWQSAGRAVDPAAAHWVGAFQSPKLTAVVQTALVNNYDLKTAAARVEAARAEARIAGSELWPQIGFAPSFDMQQVTDEGFGAQTFSAYQLLFNLNWELDIWGRIRAGKRSAEQEATSVEADLHAARLSLAARTAQTYFELAEARLQQEAAEQSVHDRHTIVDLVRGRFARGLTRGLDLRLALTDLQDAEAAVAKARNRVQLATRQLETLLGRYPAGRFKEDAALPDPPPSLPVGVPSELLERRPDVSAALERLRSADSRLESARKALLPRLALTAEGGVRSPALTELIDPRSAIYNLAAGLLQPIFTGGRLTGEIAANEARADEAINRYKETTLNAFRQVEQSLAAEERLRAQEVALREAVTQTIASQKLAVYSYQFGLIEILTLLDSYR